MIHPARLINYHVLRARLEAAIADGNVSIKSSGDHQLFCYTQQAVYSRAWDDATTMARGLIVNWREERVVATPFSKFWNLGERDEPIPDLPFDCLEKLDGSLIVLWHDGERWRCCTKGSFDSDQARAAQHWIAERRLSALVPGTTYLAEWLAPDNRIVVRYDRPELALLAAYDELGAELEYPIIRRIAHVLGWRVAERHSFDSLADLVAHAETLPSTQEGFVLRFANGLRLKVKGQEYRRIHRLISNVTPLAIWEAMAAGDDMESMRRNLPEEFWIDYDTIAGLLSDAIQDILAQVRGAVCAVADAGWTDKELGLQLHRWHEPVRSLIFPLRKHGDLMQGKARRSLFRAVRPTGNRLAGYTPSSAMNRAMDEAA